MSRQLPAGDMETGDRAAFARRFAQANWSSHRPLDDVSQDQFSVAYTGTPDFTEALTALGGVARAITDADSLIALVNDALDHAKDGRDRVRVAITNEPECAAIAYALGARDDVELVEFTDAAAVATADVGFTGARAAVARTGSIVVDAGRAGGRTVSLLPPLHVALVDAGSMLAEPGDLWRSLNGENLPSNLVQITGPSRSADIELVITLGVHGPRALWVGLCNSVGMAQ
jgi:L-lactate utilization protein LutC